MRKSIAAAGIATSLLVGAGAGIAFYGPSAVSAASKSSTAATRPTPPWIADALKKLVAAHTITQSQSDAVAKALADAKPMGGRPFGGGPFGFARGGHLSVVAKAIGIDETQLGDAIRSGKTIAQVAKDHNVDPQKVIDALVSDLQGRLSDAVKSGRLTQAQADTMKTRISQWFSALVNGERPPGGLFGGRGRRGGAGFFGPSSDGSTTPSPATTSS